MNNPLIIKFNNHNPRRNLPAHLANKRGEANFVGAFERAIKTQFGSGIGARHFALSGFGIADFIWIDWLNDAKQPNSSNIDVDFGEYLDNNILMAFEMKLNNWKKALQQAYRYSYYADRAIVVLPTETIDSAKNEIGLFKELNIGLWALDKNTGEISEIYTPNNTRAKNSSARQKAIKLISNKLNFRKFFK